CPAFSQPCLHAPPCRSPSPSKRTYPLTASTSSFRSSAWTRTWAPPCEAPRSTAPTRRRHPLSWAAPSWTAWAPVAGSAARRRRVVRSRFGLALLALLLVLCGHVDNDGVGLVLFLVGREASRQLGRLVALLGRSTVLLGVVGVLGLLLGLGALLVLF